MNKENIKSIESNNKHVRIWTNPTLDLQTLPSLVRFTADNLTQSVYVWDFNRAFHSEISISLGLNDRLDSFNFLKGHAKLNQDGKFVMVGSDYLQSFVGKMVNGDRTFLKGLLNQDWGWVENYVQVGEWVDGYKDRVVGI